MSSSDMWEDVSKRKHPYFSYLIDNSEGNWQFFAPRMPLIAQPLATFADERKRRIKARFVFKDHAAIEAFLMDDDPQLAWLREYVGMARQFNSPIAATVEELDELYSLSHVLRRDYGCCPKGVPKWVHQQCRERVAANRWWQGLSLVDSLTQMGLYSNTSVMEFDETKYWLMRNLDLKNKLRRFLLGEDSGRFDELFTKRFDHDDAYAEFLGHVNRMLLSAGTTSEGEPFVVLSEQPLLRINRSHPPQVNRVIPLDVLEAGSELA